MSVAFARTGRAKFVPPLKDTSGVVDGRSVAVALLDRVIGRAARRTVTDGSIGSVDVLTRMTAIGWGDLGRRCVQWLRDDRAQDLIEYALLAATIGFAGLGVLNVADMLDANLVDLHEASSAALGSLWDKIPDP